MSSSSFGRLIRDTLIVVNLFLDFSFSYIVRQGNTMTHALTQRACLSFPLLVWMKNVPSDVVAFDFADYHIS